jgi:hypothetical protein
MPVKSPSPETPKAGPLQSSLQSMARLKSAADESLDRSAASQTFDAKTVLAKARQRVASCPPGTAANNSQNATSTEVARVEDWLRETGMRRGWDLALLDELLSQDLAAVLATPTRADFPGDEQQQAWSNPIALRSFVQQCALHAREQQSGPVNVPTIMLQVLFCSPVFLAAAYSVLHLPSLLLLLILCFSKADTRSNSCRHPLQAAEPHPTRLQPPALGSRATGRLLCAAAGHSLQSPPRRRTRTATCCGCRSSC